jgi:carotenoid 9,10(9',10')-cleavage dioxygenase 1
MYACAHFKANIAFDNEHPFFKGEHPDVHLAHLQFNMITGKATMDIVLKEHSYEFPVVNMKYHGFKNRYAYMGYMWSEMPKDQVGKENLFFEGFIKYDL